MAKKKRIIVKSHAVERLKREKVYKIDEDTLIQIVKGPDEVVKGRGGRLIAHKILGKEYILRVIYEEYKDEIQIVTFYRAKKKRYFRGEK
ncbi:MAG: hypothetical protein U9O41_06500 [Candidatus Aerophobetes bacterium]|nr:hypothetical protein [Candidatus Aerophobetes bacterium]